MKTTLITCAAAVAVITLTLTSSPPAFASTPPSPSAVVPAATPTPSAAVPLGGEQVALSEADMAEFARELETLFTEYVTQDGHGVWVINHKARETSTFPRSDLERLVANLNAAEVTTLPLLASSSPLRGLKGGFESPSHAFGSAAYKSCVLDASGLGLFTGLFTGAAGGFWAFIGAKRWADAAWVAVRLVGGTAIRGGAVGLAASLAGAAAWCATPWAR